MLYTTKIDPESDFMTVAATTHLFQKLVPKVCDVRLTVVDDHLFAARIDAHSPAAALDFRSDYAHLTYQAIDVPTAVQVRVRELLSRLELRYAALDFVIDQNGEWVFIGDVNPNGQWAWIEDELPALTISAAIADALTPGACP